MPKRMSNPRQLVSPPVPSITGRVCHAPMRDVWFVTRIAAADEAAAHPIATLALNPH